MKKLAELTVTEFADLLASDAPAPGGGSAAALEGAIGAALTAMVCGLTKGKKKFAEFNDLAVEAEVKALALKDRFIDVMDRDTEAFNVVSAAFGMPKATDEEKAARSAAIQKGLEGCTATPFEMMEIAVETLELTDSILGKSNDSAASDLGVSALSLRAAIQGAWLNVLINIGSLKNKELAEDYRVKGEALLAKALPLADKIYAEVVTMLYYPGPMVPHRKKKDAARIVLFFRVNPQSDRVGNSASSAAGWEVASGRRTRSRGAVSASAATREFSPEVATRPLKKEKT